MFKSADNRELPQILGQMPVLSKKYWADRDFEQDDARSAARQRPVQDQSLDPGRSITYERVPDYWGADLPVNKGRYNVDTIRYDYYRDGTSRWKHSRPGNTTCGSRTARQELGHRL